MLCRFGKLTKGEIGAIRIQRNESYVELSAACADRFLETIGPSRKLENAITVTRLDHPPPDRPRSDFRRRPEQATPKIITELDDVPAPPVVEAPQQQSTIEKDERRRRRKCLKNGDQPLTSPPCPQDTRREGVRQAEKEENEQKGQAA